MYKVKGSFTKSEYYYMSIWVFRFLFVAIPVAALLPLSVGVGWETLLNMNFISLNWSLLLVKWLQYSVLISLPFFLFLILEAFLKQEAYLGPLEYVFSEEGITYRTEISQRKISWAEVDRIEEKRSFWILVLRTKEKSLIPYRFFQNQQQKQQVLSFIKERVGGKK